tara:strand:- start:88 stop:1050 length:963 start_codon:yes stop_codon:yes gene_type:complete
MNSNSLSEPKKVKGAKVKNEALRQKIISDNKNKCMPYTLEEIQTCKNITLEKRLKDFKNLCDFKADTNPKKFCGNNCLYHYQFKNLLKCKREKGSTIEEIFSNEGTKNKLWVDTIKRNRRKNAIVPSPTDVYEAHRINTGAIVFFKASTAKYIYKKYNATSVLDFSMGWGGRLLGAMALDINYIGVDTNINLKQGYENMITDLQGNKNKIKLLWQSCLDIDYSKYDYDLILTSPPYINMEMYENMTPFENDKIFYEEFLIPTMDKSFQHLKQGGKMCINISPKMFKSLIQHGYRAPDEQIDLRQQLGKKPSQDYIYVWSK